MRKNGPVRIIVLRVFIIAMIVSITLAGGYSIALVRAMTNGARQEAKSSINVYVSDFAQKQGLIESYLANLVLSNTYFKELSAAQSAGEFYLGSHELQDELDTLLAVCGESYDIMLYHRGFDTMLSVQHNLSSGTEAQLQHDRAVKTAVCEYLNGTAVEQNEWFCLEAENEFLYCRVVQYGTLYCCCTYTLSALVDKMDTDADTEMFLLYWGEPLMGEELPVPRQYLSELLLNDGASFVGRNPRYLVSCATLGSLTLIRFTPYRLIAFEPALWIVLSLILLLTAFLLGMWYLWRTVYRPMRHMAETMQELENCDGKSAALDRVYAGEEFRQVNSTVKNLLSQISELKIESYERELEKQDAQLQYLRAQIRPHFYLNCLKNLYAMAQVGEPETLQATILLLSKHMRYIFSDHENFIPLREELTMCKNYVQLFAAMNTAFSPECRIEADSAAMDSLIPPVSILTTVENSVKYALRPDTPLQLLITVSILRLPEGNTVNITLRDNGPGLSEERLVQLNHLDLKTRSDQHVGLINLVRRFTMLYGKAFNIGFFNGNPNEQYCGMRVELFFPAGKEMEENEAADC